MTTLQDRLDRLRRSFRERTDPQLVDVMDRATEELRSSGILSRMPRVGSRLPPFTLCDTRRQAVRSRDLLEAGNLVVTFYRGGW